MLILSRRTQERIVITVPPSDQTQQIVVVLASVVGYDKARIGFEADPSVEIFREEVLRRGQTAK